MRGNYFSGGMGMGGSLSGSNRRPVLTYALIAVNVVIWLAMEFEGRSRGGARRIPRCCFSSAPCSGP